MRSLGLPPSDAPDEDTPGAYAYRAPRTRTCLSGTLVYGQPPAVPEGSLTLDCMIRDISDGGAKVIIPMHMYLPPKLHLIVVRSCVAYSATVVWLKFPARGLSFSRTYKLDKPVPSELNYLRTLLGDLC